MLRHDLLTPALLYCTVTHGHIDHVGAIEPLMAAYPGLKIIFHETEAPYLEGTADPSCYDYITPELSYGYRAGQMLHLLPSFLQYKVRMCWACAQPACMP